MHSFSCLSAGHSSQESINSSLANWCNVQHPDAAPEMILVPHAKEKMEIMNPCVSRCWCWFFTVGCFNWLAHLPETEGQCRGQGQGHGQGLGGAHCSSPSSQTDDMRMFLPEALAGWWRSGGSIKRPALVSNVVSAWTPFSQRYCHHKQQR